MKLSFRRTAQLELTMKEAAIIQQSFFITQDHVDWEGLATGEKGPNGISRLGITAQEVGSCIQAFNKVYEAIASEDQHSRAFEETKLKAIE